MSVMERFYFHFLQYDNMYYHFINTVPNTPSRIILLLKQETQTMHILPKIRIQ